jgi:hypothetical protein
MTNTKIIYDTHFNGNEWFLILALLVGFSLLYFLPHRFPRKVSILFFIFGVTFGALADHIVGTVPISFYDTCDTSYFDFMDIPAILMYGPYSFLFYYIYDLLKIKINNIPLYILGWSIISTVLEWAAVQMGVFHYRHGYWLGISFIIYLVVHSVMVVLYYYIQRAQTNESF